MKIIFVGLLFISSTVFAALPPHYEQARIMTYVINQGVTLFPFDPIMSVVDLGNHKFKLTSFSKCEAQVQVIFKETDGTDIVGPAPFQELATISNSCKK